MFFEDPKKTHLTRTEQFDNFHGESIAVGSWVYFHDGARREAFSYGLLQDVPRSDYERCQNIVVYREQHFRRATAAFEQLRQVLHNRGQIALANGSPPPPQSSLDALKELQRNMRKCERKLIAAQSELEKHKPSHLRRAVAGSYNRQLSEEFLTAMKTIDS